MTNLSLTNFLIAVAIGVSGANWLQLRQLARRQEIMMAQFTEFEAELTRLQSEVQEVIALLQSGDASDQEKINAATAVLKSVNDGLDAFTPATGPQPAGAVGGKRRP